MLKMFLTEEAEEARNIAGRRPALFAADEDDEVKKLKQGACGAALNAPTKHLPSKPVVSAFLLFKSRRGEPES